MSCSRTRPRIRLSIVATLITPADFAICMLLCDIKCEVQTRGGKDSVSGVLGNQII